MDDMRFWTYGGFLCRRIQRLCKSCLLSIYGDEERKFPVMHSLVNLSFRSNQLSELARKSDNHVRCDALEL
jgi:hypothetical protein